MDTYDAHSMCRDFAKLGGAVQEQFKDVLEDTQSAIETCNHRALAGIASFIQDHWVNSGDETLKEEGEGILDELEEAGITPDPLW